MRAMQNYARARTRKRMITMALDSSTDVCSAALVQNGAVLDERLNRNGSNHAALLPKYVQELQAEATSRSLTIDRIVLSEGPGSYTGLRIGASLAKGLCYGADLPLDAVPTLAVIAFAAKTAMLKEQEAKNKKQETRTSYLICPMIDARRMEVYCALYNADLRVVQELEAKVIDEQSFSDVLNDHEIYFCGNGAEKCKSVIRHPHAHWIDDIVPTGALAGQLADALNDRTDLVQTISGKQIAYFEPNYLKEFIAAPSHVKGLH